MRWESVIASSGNEIYHLYKDDKKIASLAIHPFTKTARVECNQEKRVFQIRKEGLLRNKTVLRTEYGIKIGQLGHENKFDYIDVNGERFYYSFETNPEPKLILYKESVDNPFVSCGLNSFTKDKQLSQSSHPGLLMALCWYMFLPVKEEEKLEMVTRNKVLLSQLLPSIFRELLQRWITCCH
ncbi:MAG: hypothetical protein ACXWCT_14625 [Flavitalea sp.]